MSNDDFDIERELRASLAEHARQAPDGARLAERIIAETDRPRAVREPRSRWRGWTLPAIAAAAVAAVVGAVVGVGQLHRPEAHTARQTTPTVTSPAPVTTHESHQPPVSSTPPSVATSTGSTLSPIPHAFRVADLTFVGADEGWALGSGQCLDGSPGRCVSIIHTVDGGQSWANVQTPPADVGKGASCPSAKPCISHLRFADDQVGYAYGPTSLFMTTDGGQHWASQSGGADALETLSGNVIRITDNCGCSPGATYAVQVAATGSSAWQPVKLPGGPVTGDSVSLSRTGNDAYLAVYQNPAGGAGSAHSTLFASSDNGKHWVSRSEPCRQASGGAAGGEVDSAALTTATDGSVVVACVPRGGSTSTVATSTDAGRVFTPSGGTLPSLPDAVGAPSRQTLLCSTAAGLYRSTGGGRWQLAVASPSSGGVTFLGFENTSTGRWVTGDGSAIWTTTDAGASWTPHRFG